MTRVKAVEKEKDELEDVRNEAMDYLRLVNQVTRTKNIMFQKNLAAERAAETRAKEQLSVAQGECKVCFLYHDSVSLFIYTHVIRSINNR